MGAFVYLSLLPQLVRLRRWDLVAGALGCVLASLWPHALVKLGRREFLFAKRDYILLFQ